MKYTYDDGNVKAEIEVQAATVRMGLQRSKLISEVDEVEGADPYEYYTRKITYPSLIAASPEGLIKVGDNVLEWPPTFDQFLELPEALGNGWYEKVNKLNPQWFELPEIDEKKAKKSSKGR